MNADPVLARRARIATIVQRAKQIGYLFLSAAIVAFVVGAVADFPPWTVTVAAIGLAGACVILPVPIVLGYGVRAAERADRGETRRH